MGIMLEVMLCLLCTYINIGEVKYITEMLRLWAEHETNGDAIDVYSVGTFLCHAWIVEEHIPYQLQVPRRLSASNYALQRFIS